MNTLHTQGEVEHQSSATEILGGYYIKFDGRYLECDCGNDRFIVTANGTLCLKCTKEWFLSEPKSKPGADSTPVLSGEKEKPVVALPTKEEE